MNGNQKFLRKLNRKERNKVNEATDLILTGGTAKLDVKKLKGLPNLFRVRVGKSRIIYISKKEGNKIIFTGFRDDNTYKHFKSLIF